MRVTFTVQGSTSRELNEQAEQTLDKFADPNRMKNALLPQKEAPTWSFNIDVRPLAQDHDGTVRLWEGDVTAEIQP